MANELELLATMTAAAKPGQPPLLALHEVVRDARTRRPLPAGAASRRVSEHQGDC